MYEKLFLELCESVKKHPSEIRSRRRDSFLVEARVIIARALREKGLSFPQIGMIMNRDHSSIQYLINPTKRASRKKAMVLYHQRRKEERSQIDARAN